MQSHFADNRQIEAKQAHLNAQSRYADDIVTQSSRSASELTQFHSHFQDCMEMYAEQEKVMAYLDAHQHWFSRCAHPMKVEPIGQNAYALVVGQFGAFGYEVEPKVGLELLPHEDGIYRIQTVPVPNYDTPGYDVDFQASQAFIELPAGEYFQEQYSHLLLPKAVTRVEWKLDLSVALRFPKFIQKLPHSLIQSTGDRILRQVVRQVSRRLTHKVQEDFHTTLGLPVPKPVKKC